jgi:hypothetical protein
LDLHAWFYGKRNHPKWLCLSQILVRASSKLYPKWCALKYLTWFRIMRTLARLQSDLWREQFFQSDQWGCWSYTLVGLSSCGSLRWNFQGVMPHGKVRLASTLAYL